MHTTVREYSTWQGSIPVLFSAVFLLACYLAESDIAHSSDSIPITAEQAHKLYVEGLPSTVAGLDSKRCREIMTPEHICLTNQKQSQRVIAFVDEDADKESIKYMFSRYSSAEAGEAIMQRVHPVYAGCIAERKKLAVSDLTRPLTRLVVEREIITIRAACIEQSVSQVLASMPTRKSKALTFTSAGTPSQ